MHCRGAEPPGARGTPGLAWGKWHSVLVLVPCRSAAVGSATAGCAPVPDGRPSAVETHFITSALYVMSAGHGFQLFEAAPGSQAYDDSYADDISEVMPSPVQKGYTVTGGPRRHSHQAHRDTPSENTLYDESFPLEVRFTHQLKRRRAAQDVQPLGGHPLAARTRHRHGV